MGRRRTGKPGIVHAGGQRQIAVGEAATACQQHIALAKVDAGGADMPARPRGFGDGDAAAVGHGIFLDHDGVGAVGDHAAGEDPHRLAGPRALLSNGRPAATSPITLRRVPAAAASAARTA